MSRRLLISCIILLATIFLISSLYYVSSEYSSGVLHVNDLDIERTHNGYFLKIDDREVPLSHKNYKQLINEKHMFYEYELKYNIFSGKRATLINLSAIGDTEG